MRPAQKSNFPSLFFVAQNYFLKVFHITLPNCSQKIQSAGASVFMAHCLHSLLLIAD
jgi:hypothetical protein